MATITQPKLRIEYVPTDSLTHAPYNPRTIDDSTKKAVIEDSVGNF